MVFCLQATILGISIFPSYSPSGKAVLFRQSPLTLGGYAALLNGGIAAGDFFRPYGKSIAFPLGESEHAQESSSLQFGDSSNEIQALGLMRKSEYKSPTK